MGLEIVAIATGSVHPHEPGRVSRVGVGGSGAHGDEKMAGEHILLRLDGTFDADEGWRLHDVLSRIDPGALVTLDFSQVRRFHDFAIALLAQDISSLEGRIAARGLCQHQLRILRYFGVDVAGLDEHPSGGANASHPS